MQSSKEVSPIKMDELDRKIISLLQSDGRRPFSDIAAEVGVSEGTIRQRYQRLTNSGVLQVVGVADPFRIGYSTMAMIGVNVSIGGEGAIHRVAGRIAEFSEVSYAVMSSGRYDLLVEAITETPEEFVHFLTEKLQAVEGVLRTETFMLLRVYKMNLGGWRLARIPSREE